MAFTFILSRRKWVSHAQTPHGEYAGSVAVWCVRLAFNIRSKPNSIGDEKTKKYPKTLHIVSSIMCLCFQTHTLALGLLATEIGPKHHHFRTHCILNTNRRPMSGPYKFALTKMDSKLWVCLCVIVFVRQFVVECLWHQNQTQRRKEKQWGAFVGGARGKTFDFSPGFRSIDSTFCRLLVTLLFTICCH